MRIVHLSTYDLYGGAARAAFQLHRALREGGDDSHLVVRRRSSDRADVHVPGGVLGAGWARAQRRLDRLPLAFGPRSSGGFSVGWAPDLVAAAVHRFRPDVVHVHWIADGFMRPESLRALGVPIVWTMHDMWAFTGGCHYSGDCSRFAEQCGACPQLASTTINDLSRRGWERRRQTYATVRPLVVTPSEWMARQVRRSSLLRDASVEVIRNGFDTVRFAPRERAAVRGEFEFGENITVILAGAAQVSANTRKGFSHLVAALERLGGSGRVSSVELAVFGSEAPLPSTIGGIAVRNFGAISDADRLARLYAASDLFVAPSLSDNLPNTVIEAMACGVPVVAYDAGGIPEILDDGVNGLLAPVGQIELLATALERLVAAPTMRQGFGRAAREKAVREFSIAASVGAHRRLYAQLVAKP